MTPEILMDARSEARSLKLADFDLYPKRGFLGEADPLEFFQEDIRGAHWPWVREVQDVANVLPKLLITDKARRYITDHMGSMWSPRDGERIIALSSSAQHCLMRTVSFVGNAFVHGSITDMWSGKAEAHIPEWLAVPWCLLADQLGTTPTLSYAWYALHNWRLADPTQPISLENVMLINNFFGGLDEEGFVKIHVVVEAAWAHLPDATQRALKAVSDDNPRELEDALLVVRDGQKAAVETMGKMWRWCSPKVYYDRVRLHIAGWHNNPALPNGVMYEGVEKFGGKPQQFGGETGAQSSGIPLQYALLDVRHEDDIFLKYLLGMRAHMPRGHRAFIEKVEALSRNGLSIREYVDAHRISNHSLLRVYRQCLAALLEFLNVHYRFVEEYIAKQEQTLPFNTTKYGTGGTHALPYLKKHIDRIEALVEEV
ncbi:MAG: hypothetical protein HY457_02450 [Parcubacteria group bacterium]|nr:hypothetical protein [Parcubacteria group bacterium]